MREKIHAIAKKVLGEKNKEKLGLAKSKLFNLFDLIINYSRDGKLFYSHSMVFKQNTINKIESRITLHYHSIEKGFLHENFRYRFGKHMVLELIELLKSPMVVENHNRTQIAVGYLAICKYYQVHRNNEIDISDYFKYDDYEYFNNLSTMNFELIKNHNDISFFEKSQSGFNDFSKSRMSTRSFTGEKVSLETINKVIELAKVAPSVCNRQPVKVYYVEQKVKIDKILDIQKGLKGFSDEISQLFILVSDRNYYYSIGERNQLYIDGGVFLMNLLYALHYYKIGACPAHWGFNYKQDKEIQKELNLSGSEKVICLIPIGIPKEEFKTTLSLRRKNEEILKIVKDNN